MSALVLTGDINAPWPDYYPYLFGFMLAAIFVIVVLLLVWLRARYRSESEEVNRAIGSLQAAIGREEGSVRPMDGDESALETLLNVCPELPRWTRYRTRNFTFRNPGIGSVIEWVMVALIISWAGFASFGLGRSIVLVIFGLLMLLYAHTKWKNIVSDRRSLEQWRSRIGTLKDEIENKLQEL